MIIATAGHIDHGKTTLVKALTGVDTDRLPEEKARGISIDLGFAYWTSPDEDAVLGFVDVPGHERFVRNMLAGVCGVDYVMLTVAADDGIKPQTVEHLNIVDLLGLSRGIALITKSDRVPAARIEEVATEVKSLLAQTSLAGAAAVPVSALSGQGIDELRRSLVEAARAHGARAREGKLFRFAVDRVFTAAGSGTVTTGTVFDGEVSAGDKLVLSPSGFPVRVRGIQKDGRAADKAGAGERCALNLAGVERSQVSRGDWVLDPFLHAPTRRMDVRIRVLRSEAQALKHWTPVHLHLGARDVLARVALRRGAAIEPGGSGIAQLILDQPIAALTGDRFILRDQSALRTVGGGAVVDPFVPRQRRNTALHAARLEALERPDPAAALAALTHAEPGGVDLARFGRCRNLDRDALESLAGKAGLVVLGKERSIALPRAALEAIKTGVGEQLRRFHEQSPQKAGMEIAELREQCAPALPAETFALVLRLLADEKRIELGGSSARLPRHVATSNPADEAAWQKIRPELENAGTKGLTLAELAAAARIKEGVLKDFLHRKAATGEVVKVTAERFYLRATLAGFVAAARAAAKGAPGGKFTAAQFRDQVGLGRARAIEILECLDRLRITQRIGDARIFRGEPQ